MTKRLLLLSALGAVGIFAACSSSESTSSSSGGSSSGDGGGSSSSGGSSSGDAGGGSDAGRDVVLDIGPGVKSCNGTYVDRTDPGAARTIQWDQDVMTRPERCMMIKVGQKVKWNGDFTVHSLEANGAEADNPIHADIGDVGEITFTRAATFGYTCAFHGTEVGAIKVVP